jgi:hypothetical protein
LDLWISFDIQYISYEFQIPSTASPAQAELRLIFGRDMVSVQLPRSSTGGNCNLDLQNVTAELPIFGSFVRHFHM